VSKEPLPFEVLDFDALTRYFKSFVPGFSGTLQAELIHGGRSNLTYRISDGDRHWVLRRPPLGLVAPTANDIGREHRVVAALGPTPVPVARAVAYCDDSAVIGAPFSVASMVEGRVIRSAADGAALEQGDPPRIAKALITGLATIHAVPYREVGLSEFGRPEGYLRRQVDRWHRQWEIVTTRVLPRVDHLHAQLITGLPTESEASIVHGDFRLDNTILDADDLGVLAAIVDWEMATLGDPLADLGRMLVYWDPACTAVLPDGHSISANHEFPSVEDMADSYSAISGRSLDHPNFYRALSYFKLAVIAEGIHNRFLARLTVGDGFETVGSGVVPLIDAGLAMLAA
jgi:aminoglycoside phosphotransferase (APT) family kinase protein